MGEVFAQLSDPHLTTLYGVSAGELLNKRLLGYLSWRRKRRFEHRIEVLDALRADLDARPPGHLLVTGDLTHIGLPSEFRQAADWLQQLGSPADVALVPGNHDACVALSAEQGLDLWRAYMASDEAGSGEFPSLRRRGGIAYIGLSSAVPTPPLMASGTLGPGQRERLVPLLRATREAGMFRVIYLHHSPVPGAERWRKRLTDAPELAAIIAEEGAELVVHGHGHRAQQHWLESRVGPVPVVSVPSASAMGLHGKDVAGYNRYAVENTGNGWEIEVERLAFDAGAGRFSTASIDTLSLAR